MIEAHDYRALWLKSKLFLNRATDPDDRSEDERMLWASLGLELLAKAALAKVSPLLIADPTEEGGNLLIATGLVPDTGRKRFTTVKAKAVFHRCERLFRPFSAQEAERIVAARNEYLHAAGIGFFGIPPQVWWPRYWAQARTLITALDREIEEFVGPDRIAQVDAHLAQYAQNVQEHVEAQIERAKQRLSQFRAGSLPLHLAAEWNSPHDLSAQLPYQVAWSCPACEAVGKLEGESIQSSEIIYSDDGEPTEWLAVDADYFSCPTCHLTLNGVEYLEEAGVETMLEIENEDFDPLDIYDEPDYGND